jgi:hypothetical protein
MAKDGKELPKRNFVYCDPTLIDDQYLVHKYFVGRELCEELGIDETTRLNWKKEAFEYIMNKNYGNKLGIAQIKEEEMSKKEAAAAAKKERQQKKIAKDNTKQARNGAKTTGKRKNTKSSPKKRMSGSETSIQ